MAWTGPKAFLLTLTLAATGLTGCIGASDDLDANSARPLDELLGTVLQLTEGGGWALDVPVTVVTIGFEPGVADALAEALTPEQAFHAHSSFTQTLPPDPSDPQLPLLQGEGFDHPHIPTAVFDVVEMDVVFTKAFWSFVAANPVESEEPDVFDANAAEQYLFTELQANGVAVTPAVPTLVLVHANGALPAGHAWRYTLPEGWLEPVRHFGEFTPLIVHDFSARIDPYVVREGPSLSPLGLVFGTLFGPPEQNDYNYPQAADASVVPDLEAYVRDAVHHRVLQGAIYPVSTKPCHHVTLLMAVDQSALTNVLPGFTRAEDWVDAERLNDAFVNLTEDEVTTDLTWLMLPQEEPALAALVRGAAGFATLDALRFYLHQNWEDFVTPVDGCEEYLSIMYFADAASHAARVFGGIGMYDVDTDRRISFSIVTDVTRIQDEYAGPGAEIITVDDPDQDEATYVNLLFSHETGHLFGMHHPQHLFKARDPSPANDAFQSVYTVMSYQTGTRIIDFGDIDTANFQRNRAGFSVFKAQVLGLEETPEFREALQSLVDNEWRDAHLAVEAGIQRADREHTPETSFHAWSSHEHPW